MEPCPQRPHAAVADLSAKLRAAGSAEIGQRALSLLATDGDILVRSAVAMNSYAPAEIQALVASDHSASVRRLLSATMGEALPRRVAEPGFEATLMRLAEDPAEQVRSTLAEQVCMTPATPRPLALRLAVDPAPAVSGPVLRVSPVLDDKTLIEIAQEPPHAQAYACLAGRSSITSRLGHVLAANGDVEAVTILLENSGANLDDATLSDVARRSRDRARWQVLLSERPKLPRGAYWALFNNASLGVIETLAAREDMPIDVRRRLPDLERLRQASPAEAQMPDLTPDQAMSMVRRAQKLNRISEASFIEAARTGRRTLAIAQLAVMAGATVGAVGLALSESSMRALVSLVWRCGFGVNTSLVAQIILAGRAPGDLLRDPTPETWPMQAVEMRWHLQRLRDQACQQTPPVPVEKLPSVMVWDRPMGPHIRG